MRRERGRGTERKSERERRNVKNSPPNPSRNDRGSRRMMGSAERGGMVRSALQGTGVVCGGRRQRRLASRAAPRPQATSKAAAS